MRYLIFTDIHGNSRGLPSGPQGHPEEADRPLHLPRRSRRLRRLPERGHPAHPDAQAPVDHPRQPRQGRLRPRFRPDLQSHRRLGHLLDEEDDRPQAPRLPGPAETEPRGHPGFDHHLPRRALRRGLLHLRRVRRGRGLLVHPDAGLLLRPHPLPLRLHREGRQRRGHVPRGQRQRDPAREGRPLPHQSRLGRPAPGPEPAGGLRHLRLRGPDDQVQPRRIRHRRGQEEDHRREAPAGPGRTAEPRDLKTGDCPRRGLSLFS